MSESGQYREGSAYVARLAVWSSMMSLQADRRGTVAQQSAWGFAFLLAAEIARW